MLASHDILAMQKVDFIALTPHKVPMKPTPLSCAFHR